MQLDKALVCDIETTGFLDSIKSFDDLHVFGCAYKSSNGKWGVKTTNKFSDIEKVIGDPNNIVVFHNGILYDKPVLIKMGFKFNAFLIDTLGLSYYLYSERDKHGLAAWGEFFGVEKPEIESWTGLSYEEYVNRVTEDCKINTNLWVMMLSYLRNIYGDDDKVLSAIKKINHKMDQLAMQDQNPIFINVPECKKNLQFLDTEVAESKESVLNSLLPKIPVKKIVAPPKKGLFKKDGTLSEVGKKWLTYVQACNLPDDYSGNIEVITGYKDPNCNSSDQMKSYLLSKGWVPTIYKDGADGKVPQLRDDDKNLCPNIIKLIDKYPELEALSGLSVARHRAGYLKSMLKNVNDNGYAKAWANGFTRTLRLKHAAPFANLPKPNAEHGRLVRGVMVAPEGYVCIGADLSSIEDKCKQVSIFKLDPDYVQSMNTPGWDAHLALGLTAKMFTQEEVDFYKWYNNRSKENSPYVCPDMFTNLREDEMHEMFEVLSKKRAVAKTGTYSCTYGAGAQKISESTGLSLGEAKQLHKGYWDLNWSVKKFAEDRVVKTVRGTNWLKVHKNAGGTIVVKETNWIYNEYTGLWMFLKNEKDRFSACNQSMGVFIFDVWVWYLMKYGIKVSATWHDEAFWYCKEDEVDEHIDIIKKSIDSLNKYFNFPVYLECDYKIGKTYADVH